MGIVELADQAAVLHILLELIQLILVLLSSLCGDDGLFLDALELHPEGFKLLHELGDLSLLVESDRSLIGELTAELLVALPVLLEQDFPILDDLLVCLQLSCKQFHLLFQMIR